jgi:hypothetical protein
MADHSFQPGVQHPDEWRGDLNPNANAGVNDGLLGKNPVQAGNVRTAYDLKDLHNRLQGFTDNELQEIVVLPQGSRLEQGATYIDLRDPQPKEFTAMGGMEAGPENWYVPKSGIDYVLWNRLIGVTNPERLDQAGEP